MKRRYRISYCEKSAFIDTFKTMNNRGVTLMELLIVVAIIGILAMAATTAYIGIMKKAARSEAYTNLESLRLLEEQFFAENACYEPLAGGACPGGNNLYTGTPAIQAFLPGFLPGAGLSYNYAITQNQQITNNTGNTVANPPTFGALTSCYVATATGIAGTRVCSDPANCDEFAIDCNNNRNF
jgi:prepilin-type N-terminal cleavage/methylation domain-containing protein